MDDKQLIDKILNRVLERMKNSQTVQEPGEDKPKLLILTQEHGNRCHELLENTKLLEHYIMDCSFVMDYDCRLEDYEAVILFNLSNTVLSKLSRGICDSPFLNLASNAILTGRKIYIPMEEVELFHYKDTAPEAFYSMMLDKINFLESCGVVFCETEQLEKAVLHKAGKTEGVHNKKENVLINPVSQKTITIDKKVVTEKDIEKAYINGGTVICISNRAILSDLAKDYAKYRNIQFRPSEILAGKPRNCV